MKLKIINNAWNVRGDYHEGPLTRDSGGIREDNRRLYDADIGISNPWLRFFSLCTTLFVYRIQVIQNKSIASIDSIGI